MSARHAVHTLADLSLGSARSQQGDGMTCYEGDGMTYYEAAIEVLKAAKRPLTAEEITNCAIEKGLITSNGKTPAMTMASKLYMRLPNDPNLVKLADRDGKRAKKGSVRWTLRHF